MSNFFNLVKIWQFPAFWEIFFIKLNEFVRLLLNMSNLCPVKCGDNHNHLSVVTIFNKTRLFHGLSLNLFAPKLRKSLLPFSACFGFSATICLADFPSWFMVFTSAPNSTMAWPAKPETLQFVRTKWFIILRFHLSK